MLMSAPPRPTSVASPVKTQWALSSVSVRRDTFSVVLTTVLVSQPFPCKWCLHIPIVFLALSTFFVHSFFMFSSFLLPSTFRRFFMFPLFPPPPSVFLFFLAHCSVLWLLQLYEQLPLFWFSVITELTACYICPAKKNCEVL